MLIRVKDFNWSSGPVPFADSLPWSGGVRGGGGWGGVALHRVPLKGRGRGFHQGPVEKMWCDLTTAFNITGAELMKGNTQCRVEC